VFYLTLWWNYPLDSRKPLHQGIRAGLTITTNSVEGYFSIVRRGIDGIYHHIGRQYLDRYLRAFDYRYNVRRMNDRTELAIMQRKDGVKPESLPSAASI
jgi:hypothetical protein